jgi:hypothetical protein
MYIKERGSGRGWRGLLYIMKYIASNRIFITQPIELNLLAVIRGIQHTIKTAIVSASGCATTRIPDRWYGKVWARRLESLGTVGIYGSKYHLYLSRTNSIHLIAPQWYQHSSAGKKSPQGATLRYLSGELPKATEACRALGAR